MITKQGARAKGRKEGVVRVLNLCNVDERDRQQIFSAKAKERERPYIKGAMLDGRNSNPKIKGRKKRKHQA